jgi:hypothetical protein
MGTLFDLELARERRYELLHEVEERRLARALRRFRQGDGEDHRAEKEPTVSCHST